MTVLGLINFISYVRYIEFHTAQIYTGIPLRKD